MKKIILIIFLLFSFTAGLVYCDTLSSHFDKANTLFEEKDYIKALDLYLKIYEQGFYSKDLFYNISNTHYRLGNIGQSLRYIEKAYRISPRDSDIRFNRKLLYTNTGQTENVWESIIGFLSINELSIICLVLVSLIFIFLIISKFITKRWLYWVKFGVISLTIIFSVWLYASYLIFYKNPYGVVLPQEINAYSGPSLEQTISFTVPAGQKIVILGKSNGWLDIGVKKDRLRGWIQEQEIGII
ncbi:SH3 domain-containing protein [bacterium]